MKKLIPFLAVLALPLQASVHNGYAEITSPNKKITGEVQFRPMKDGVKIRAEVTGLAPKSVHGFHIHETGKCEGPDFKSAGGHYNPGHEAHGAPTSSVKHLGDLGNLVANDKGVAIKEVDLTGLSEKDVRELYGKALILHAKPDDFSSQPSGAAGDRVGCGVIKEGKL